MTHDHGVRLERRGPVAILTLDRPDRRNAMDAHMFASLSGALDALEAALPRAVVLTGAGTRAFCAGMDVNPDNPMIAAVMQAVQDHDPDPVRAMLGDILSPVRRLVDLPVPTIAAVNGLAYGGGAELAVQCDLRVLDPDATFCFSEVKLGLMPDWGGGVALTRLLGPAHAADLILTAREVHADEALRLGLANRLSDPGRALPHAVDLANAVAANGPRAVRYALDVIRATPGATRQQARARELDRAVDLIASGECVHGISAFLSRATPEFPDIDEA